MSLIDFFIGFFLMNAMPHFVIGIWRGRMFSLFGTKPIHNIIYGICNFIVAMILFFYQYGFAGLKEQGMFVGALFILLAYFMVAQLCYKKLNPRYPDGGFWAKMQVKQFLSSFMRRP